MRQSCFITQSVQKVSFQINHVGRRRFFPLLFQFQYFVINETSDTTAWKKRVRKRFKIETRRLYLSSSFHIEHVKFRIQFKVLVITYRALQGQTAVYITDYCSPESPAGL